jgi:large subunit ribosomal protein L29
MKASEVRERTDEELENLEKDLARELWQARFDNHTNQLDDTSKVKKLRRDIARAKTILTERRSREGQE